jgi:hypothetical protein
VIVLYHDDFDGLASAALLAVWLLQDGMYRLEDLEFVAVDHHHDLDWTAERPRPVPAGREFAVVDFPFHRSALVWVDHHPTAFKTDADQALYETQAGTGSWLWARESSCARLIWTQLLGPGARASDGQYRELVAAADLIDTADYATPLDYFKAVHPAIALSHTHGSFSAADKTDIIQRMVGGEPLGRIRDRYGALIKAALDQNDELLYETSTVTQLRGVVAIVDLADQGLGFLHFAPYFFHPECLYALTLFRAGDDIRVSLGKNPWREFVHADLGAVARTVGGGGHPFAAGAQFMAAQHFSPYTAALTFVHQTANGLNARHGGD